MTGIQKEVKFSLLLFSRTTLIMHKEPLFVFEYKITVSYFLFQFFFFNFTARIMYSLLLCTGFGVMPVEINFTRPLFLINSQKLVSVSQIYIVCGKNYVKVHSGQGKPGQRVIFLKSQEKLKEKLESQGTVREF